MLVEHKNDLFIHFQICLNQADYVIRHGIKANCIYSIELS
jgi:hypothetical protein